MGRIEKYRQLRDSLNDVEDWTDWLYEVPSGWRNLCLDMFIEIYKLFKDNNCDPEELYISEMKEKWGTLRVYYWLNFNSVVSSSDIDSIISKYEEMSKTTCIICGSSTSHTIKGLGLPVCDRCIEDGKVTKTWTD